MHQVWIHLIPYGFNLFLFNEYLFQKDDKAIKSHFFAIK